MIRGNGLLSSWRNPDESRELHNSLLHFKVKDVSVKINFYLQKPSGFWRMNVGDCNAPFLLCQTGQRWLRWCVIILFLPVRCEKFKKSWSFCFDTLSWYWSGILFYFYFSGGNGNGGRAMLWSCNCCNSLVLLQNKKSLTLSTKQKLSVWWVKIRNKRKN